MERCDKTYTGKRNVCGRLYAEYFTDNFSGRKKSGNWNFFAKGKLFIS